LHQSSAQLLVLPPDGDYPLAQPVQPQQPAAPSVESAGVAYANSHPRLLEAARSPGVFSRYQLMMKSYSDQLQKREEEKEAKEDAERRAAAQQAAAQNAARQQQQQSNVNRQVVAAAAQAEAAQAAIMQSQATPANLQSMAAAQPSMPYNPAMRGAHQSQQFGAPQEQEQLSAPPVPLFGAQYGALLPSPPQFAPTPPQFAAPQAPQQDDGWQSPKLFSSYRRNMQKINAPELPTEVTSEYRVYDSTTNNCGPVPMRPLRLHQGENAQLCQQQCNEQANCIGFVTDMSQSMCLFRSWASLENCKKRYHRSMLQDERYTLLLKKDLILDKNVL